MPEASTLDRDVSRIAEAIFADDVSAVETYLEGVLGEIRDSGADPNDVLPVADESGIGFSSRRIDDADSFWRAILLATRDLFCAKDGKQVNKIVKGASPTGGAALVAALVAGLGVPPFAVGAAVVIAGIVTAVGVGGLCIWLDAHLDGD